MQKSVQLYSRNLALALLLSIGCEAAAATKANGYDDVLSFDMWCLEMRLYPSARCDARQDNDVKAYEQYRTATERFDQERAARAKRDLELKQRLDRDPTSGKPTPGPGK